MPKISKFPSKCAYWKELQAPMVLIAESEKHKDGGEALGKFVELRFYYVRDTLFLNREGTTKRALLFFC